MRLPPLLVLTALWPVLSPRAAAQEPEASAPRPRSVVFYLVDTCRGDRLGFDGYGRGTTPFLDWLAARSVVFESCSSQAPWTKPSMASMLTSQYPSTVGLYRMDQKLDPAARTWPEVVREGGRYTVGFSANPVMGNELSGLAQGFDHFVESTAINRGDPIRFASGSAKLLNDHAFAWLDGNERWPLLLYLHSVDPHEEYEPEPQYLARFADPARHPRFREEWRKLVESRPLIPGLFVTQANFDGVGIDARSFVTHASNLYDADVAANDDQLRRLWDRLQQGGWGEDLVFVLTSDHGEEFFEHGGTSHGYSLYQEVTRVPLLIHAPGLLPAGKRVSTPVRSLDVYPTLCELLGLPVPTGLEGQSLVPLAHGAETSERPVFAEHREDPILRRMGQGSGVLVSLRRGRWKLIRNELGSQYFERPPVELYDLESDPREQHDVAAEHPEVVARLAGEIEAFMARQRERGSEVASSELSPEVLAQLRALGYVGEESVPDLWTALEGGNLEAVQAALAGGVDPDLRDPVFGLRPLSFAALGGNLALARVLRKAGAAVDARNADGATPLSGAAFLGRPELLEFLLDEGADPKLASNDGTTPLAATRVPWSITEPIAKLLGIPVDRQTVEAGRAACAEILEIFE